MCVHLRPHWPAPWSRSWPWHPLQGGIIISCCSKTPSQFTFRCSTYHTRPNSHRHRRPSPRSAHLWIGIEPWRVCGVSRMSAGTAVSPSRSCKCWYRDGDNGSDNDTMIRYALYVQILQLQWQVESTRNCHFIGCAKHLHFSMSHLETLSTPPRPPARPDVTTNVVQQIIVQI